MTSTPQTLSTDTAPAAEPDGAPLFRLGPARRPAPQLADARLQWASGLTTTARQVYAGWLSAAGVDAELDAAMAQAGIGQVTIKHGSGAVVTYWAAEQLSLFVIAEGVQTLTELKQTSARYGIAFGWGQTESGRPQSQLRCRVLARELLAVGYTAPLLLSVKGTLTGDLITALLHQYAVLDAAEALRAARGQAPLHAPFYAFSLPLGPGAEVTRGSVQTKRLTPIVAAIPNPIPRDYLAAHWIGAAWARLAEAQLDATLRWSVASSAAIGAGAAGHSPPAERPNGRPAAPLC